MNQRDQLRWGAITLMLSAVLTLGGLLLRGPLIIEIPDAAAFARSVASPNNLIAESFLPLSLVIQMFGFLGMFAYLDKPEAHNPTFWGMVFSILGNGLFLPFAGIFAFAVPIIGQLYLQGNSEVITVAELALGPGIGFVYLIASAIALTVGAVLFAISMWKHDLPHWLPVIYVIQAFGLSFGASIGYPFEITGGILLVIFSIVLGTRMWK